LGACDSTGHRYRVGTRRRGAAGGTVAGGLELRAGPAVGWAVADDTAAMVPATTAPVTAIASLADIQ
jgi:hypothetical protein